eukprot:3360352-Rhodomonas_salina.1
MSPSAHPSGRENVDGLEAGCRSRLRAVRVILPARQLTVRLRGQGDDESVGVAGAGDRDARRQVGWLQGANVERVRGREHPARPAAAQAQGGRQTRRVGVGSAVAARASRPHNGP